MRINIEELQAKLASADVFVRGDCNSSRTNSKGHRIFSKFCSDLSLARVQLHHNSYHHFPGHGSSDSELDVLLYSKGEGISEQLLNIVCKHHTPQVESHHDLLLSLCSVLPVQTPSKDKSKNVIAPKLKNTRHRIIWNEDTWSDYKALVSSHLPRIREQWWDTSSEISMTILLQTTNMVLSQSALLFNKFV